MDFKKDWQTAIGKIRKLFGSADTDGREHGPIELRLESFAVARGLILHAIEGNTSIRVTFSGGILLVENHRAIQPLIFGDGRNHEDACESLIEQIKGKTIAVGPPPGSRIVTVPEVL